MDNREPIDPIDVININIFFFFPGNILYGNLISMLWKSGLDYFFVTWENN